MMKDNKTRTILIISIIITTVSALGSAVPNTHHKNQKSPVDIYFSGFTDYISTAFETELPLIILKKTTDGKAYLRVIDNGTKNRTDSMHSTASEVVLQAIRYENDKPRPKEDYFFALDDSAQPLQILDLKPVKRWLLLGGMYDKSLVRNYLGYSLASLVLENAPQFRLCEVLLEEHGGFRYQGVYLLVEGASSETAVTFRRTEHYWEGFGQTVVADDYAGKFVLLENWNGGTEQHVKEAGDALTNISGMFYSNDTNYYLRYDNILDIDSFCVYFLINELLANYEDMGEAIFTYDSQTKKLYIDFMCNFDTALDNQKNEPMNIRRLIYQNAPFYRHMIRDGEFINRIVDMSKKHTDVFSGKTVDALIDAAVDEIGTAQERDWRRWGYFYFSAENALPPQRHLRSVQTAENGLSVSRAGQLLVEIPNNAYWLENAPNRVRQFNDYEQEIIKMRYYANSRPLYLRSAVTLLKNQENLLGQVDAYGINTILAVVFLTVLTGSIMFARRTLKR